MFIRQKNKVREEDNYQLNRNSPKCEPPNFQTLLFTLSFGVCLGDGGTVRDGGFFNCFNSAASKKTKSNKNGLMYKV